METIDSTLTTSAKLISMPSDLLSVKRFQLDTDPIRLMEFRTNEAIMGVYDAGNGMPAYFTLIGNQAEFNRTPDSAYAATLFYYAKPDPLATTATNDVLTAYPNCYLYGALKQAEPFLGNDVRLTVWQNLYNESVAIANKDDDFARYSGSSLSVTVNGAIA